MVLQKQIALSVQIAQIALSLNHFHSAKQCAHKRQMALDSNVKWEFASMQQKQSGQMDLLLAVKAMEGSSETN